MRCSATAGQREGQARIASQSYCRLVRVVDEYVAYHAASPIYSADLAAQCDVSIRTLGTAVASVRGMSLHRYLRLKHSGPPAHNWSKGPTRSP